MHHSKTSSTYITPVGRLVWPSLNTARQFQNKGDFSYDTKFDVEGEEGRELEQLILNYAQDFAKRSGKRSPIDLSGIILEALDKDNQPIPDTVRFSFRSKVRETKRGVWDRKPAFYKADGQPYTPEPQIGSGTMAQIAFTIYEWVFGGRPGITLQPEGLLIHELKSPGGSAAVDRSFSALFGSVGVVVEPQDGAQIARGLQQSATGGNF